MNKFLLAILLFVTSATFAQRVYSPSVDGVPGRNQPVGISGTPLDGRAQFHDTTANASKRWRDFQSTAEVLSYYNTAGKREGKFSVFIHSGGSLSSGVWTGGSTVEYWFKDGVTDADLVVKSGSVDLSAYTTLSRFLDSIAAVRGSINSGGVTFSVDSAKTRGATTVALYGNSLAYGSGGQSTVDYPDGTPWAEALKNISGYNVIRFAVPGQSSTQIKDRFLADVAANPSRAYWGYIFEMGTNNSGSPATVKSDIAACVAVLTAVGNNRYLVMGVPGFSNPSYWIGTSNYNNIISLNNDLASIYGIRFVNVRAALTAYPATGATAQDTADHNHDIPLTRWMYPGDPVHYNDAGYNIWAQQANSKSYLLKPGSDQVSLGTGSVLEMFKNAPPVNTPQVIAKRAVIGFPMLRATTYLDGGGFNQPLALELNGGLGIWNRRAYGTATEGGIMFRDYLPDVGGRAIVSMMGTNDQLWTSPAQGIFPSNNQLKWNIGAPLAVTGSLEVSGSGNFGALTSPGLNISGGPIWNTGAFTSPRRVLDLQSAGGSLSGGVILPHLDEGQYPGIFERKAGETGYNPTFERYFTFVPDPSITNALKPKYTAYTEDLPTIENGAGISISKNGTVYTVTNTTLPPANKLTGTIFATSEVDAARNSAKAFDSVITTYWQSQAADVTPVNWIGLTLPTPAVATLVRIYAADGLTLIGAKIQGSNTSTTAGFTDLYTFTSDLFYEWRQIPITSTTPYKYLRILQAPGSYVHAAKEIEFYGYVPAPPIAVTTTGTSGPATLNGNILNIPQYSGGGNSYTFTGPLANSGGVVSVVPDANHRWFTDAMKAKYDSALFKITGSIDSTLAIFQAFNGRKDTLDYTAFVSGSGPGGGTGTVTSVTVGNLANFATASVGTGTSTPVVTFSLLQTPAHRFFGNNTAGTTAPSYVAIDTSDIAGFAAKVRSVLSVGAGMTYNPLTGQFTSTATGNAGTEITMKNAPEGDSSITRIGDTIFHRGRIIVPGVGLSASKVGSTNLLDVTTLSVTGPPISGEYQEEITQSSYAVSLSNGGTQNLTWAYTGNGNMAFPTGAATARTVYYLTNPTNATIALNINIYTSSVTWSSSISPGENLKLVVEPKAPYRYFIYKH